MNKRLPERREECGKRCGNIHTGVSDLLHANQHFRGMYVRVRCTVMACESVCSSAGLSSFSHKSTEI